MALERIISVSGRAVHVPGDDIDTDRIIPARFMKCVTFDGLGEYAFFDERFDSQNNPRPDFPLNRPEHQGASILLSGANFGCGSSREHAPQSLYYYGFRAVIAVSFAEIFFGNATQIGIVCFAVSREGLAQLVAAVEANPGQEISISVEAQTARIGDIEVPGEISDAARRSLLEGRWDPIAELLEAGEAVDQRLADLQYGAGVQSA